MKWSALWNSTERAISCFPWAHSVKTLTSLGKLDEKYNADLANGLGNLLSRVITLYQKIEGELDFTTDKKIIAQDEIRNKNIEDMSLGVELGDVWASIRAIDKTLERENLGKK